jgi:hypothetical protein
VSSRIFFVCFHDFIVLLAKFHLHFAKIVILQRHLHAEPIFFVKTLKSQGNVTPNNRTQPSTSTPPPESQRHTPYPPANLKDLKKAEGCVLRGVTADSFCRLMPQLGKRVHTKWGNGYYVVKIKE